MNSNGFLANIKLNSIKTNSIAADANVSMPTYVDFLPMIFLNFAVFVLRLTAIFNSKHAWNRGCFMALENELKSERVNDLFAYFSSCP